MQNKKNCIPRTQESWFSTLKAKKKKQDPALGKGSCFCAVNFHLTQNTFENPTADPKEGTELASMPTNFASPALKAAMCQELFQLGSKA